MKPEDFESALLQSLEAHRRRYPTMEAADEVKMVFQGMLGPGHLIAGRKQAAEGIAREAEKLTGGICDPLFTFLSPAWCRLDLRGALNAGFTPDLIAGMMLSCPDHPPYTRRDVIRFLEALPLKDGPLRVPADSPLRSGEGLPSHSRAYHEAYRPAYRVMDSLWMACGDALLRILGERRAGQRMLVTLDGPCAGGKTTLASKLAEVFGAQVIHTDDFVIPHEMKTPERLRVPGGNCDASRLIEEVLDPWKRGENVRFRRYDCRQGCLCPAEILPEGDMLILEGCYSGLPAVRRYADVPLFLDTPWDVRKERLERRESRGSLKRFHDMWIPLEKVYFEAFGLPDGDCTLIEA